MKEVNQTLGNLLHIAISNSENLDLCVKEEINKIRNFLTSNEEKNKYNNFGPNLEENKISIKEISSEQQINSCGLTASKKPNELTYLKDEPRLEEGFQPGNTIGQTQSNKMPVVDNTFAENCIGFQTDN